MTTLSTDDVVRRNLPRELPCKLTEEDFVRISRTRVQKEAERDELVTDLADETRRRKDQIKALDDEIGRMGRELRTGEQERTVKCNEVFRKHEDGTGWIYVLRLDTFDEVERRPATAHETQRYLPSIDGTPPTGGSLLDQAARGQRSAQDDATPDVPDDDDVPADGEGDEGDDDADDTDGKPAKKRGGRKAK